MSKLCGLLILFVLLTERAWSLDEFSGIKCGTDIPKALIGQKTTNGRVVVAEQRHKDIGLRDLGGIEESDKLFLLGWEICGSEFELLINNKTNRISDVLLVPPHSKTSPEAVGGCKLNGKDFPDGVLAILDNSAGLNAADQALASTMLKAKVAWRIDEAHEHFVSMPIDGLTCTLSSIFTVDGGS